MGNRVTEAETHNQEEETTMTTAAQHRIATPATGSEIAPHSPDGQQVAPLNYNPGVAVIDAELAVIEKAAPLIDALIMGGMAPATYLPTFQPTKTSKPQGIDVARAKALAAAVYGASIGFGVTQSLQNVFTVHGQPAIYARTAVALAQSRGHEVQTVFSTPEKVIVRGRRKGSEHWETAEWDFNRATRAGFTTNPKYKSQPQEMLYAKAAMEVCRKIIADVLKGIGYSVEELNLENKWEDSRRMDQQNNVTADNAMDAVTRALGSASPSTPEVTIPTGQPQHAPVQEEATQPPADVNQSVTLDNEGYPLLNTGDQDEDLRALALINDIKTAADNAALQVLASEHLDTFSGIHRQAVLASLENRDRIVSN